MRLGSAHKAYTAGRLAASKRLPVTEHPMGAVPRRGHVDAWAWRAGYLDELLDRHSVPGVRRDLFQAVWR